MRTDAVTCFLRGEPALSPSRWQPAIDSTKTSGKMGSWASCSPCCCEFAEIITCVHPLLLQHSFQISLTFGQYFGCSQWLEWWGNPTFILKRNVLFVVLPFFPQVIFMHIYFLTHQKSRRIILGWIFRSISPTMKQDLTKPPFIMQTLNARCLSRESRWFQLSPGI